MKMNEEIKEEEVELAERYADVLQDIRRLKKEISFTKDDVDQAEKYLATLKAIKEQKVKAKNLSC